MQHLYYCGNTSTTYCGSLTRNYAHILVLFRSSSGVVSSYLTAHNNS